MRNAVFLLLFATVGLPAQNLPRVLVIGDSISIGYTPPVRALLRGQADVQRIPENAAHTRNGLAKLAQWIGAGKWDLIHVNFGLHDLRRMEDGLWQVPVAEYEANLTKIFDVLEKTGAKLVFATTTPVPFAKVSPPRASIDVDLYNAAARRALAGRPVTIVDLYAAALPRLAEIQQRANVHFYPDGSEFLAGEVVKAWQPLLAR